MFRCVGVGITRRKIGSLFFPSVRSRLCLGTRSLELDTLSMKEPSYVRGSLSDLDFECRVTFPCQDLFPSLLRCRMGVEICLPIIPCRSEQIELAEWVAGYNGSKRR